MNKFGSVHRKKYDVHKRKIKYRKNLGIRTKKIFRGKVSIFMSDSVLTKGWLQKNRGKPALGELEKQEKNETKTLKN